MLLVIPFILLVMYIYASGKHRKCEYFLILIHSNKGHTLCDCLLYRTYFTFLLVLYLRDVWTISEHDIWNKVYRGVVFVYFHLTDKNQTKLYACWLKALDIKCLAQLRSERKMISLQRTRHYRTTVIFTEFYRAIPIMYPDYLRGSYCLYWIVCQLFVSRNFPAIEIKKISILVSSIDMVGMARWNSVKMTVIW